MGKPSRIPAELRAADRLHSATIHLLRRLRAVDEASGLSPARLSVLSVLVFGGPASLSQLANLEQVKPPTMTLLVRGLEADGLVRRHQDRVDRRMVRVTATRRGADALWKGRRRRVEALAKLMGSLPRRDRETLGRSAEVLHRMLERDQAAIPTSRF